MFIQIQDIIWVQPIRIDSVTTETNGGFLRIAGIKYPVHPKYWDALMEIVAPTIEEEATEDDAETE